MKPIYKFILHVVHNWNNDLKEAYAPSVVSQLMDKFKEEADDLNIQITDNQLKAYINRFDQLRGNSTNIQEKDLFKYSLSQLIRLVTSSKGVEEPEEAIDITPDVVYNQDGITIWNGSKEGNCITYGAGEKWCITRGSFGTYRYSVDKGNPTFYLAKNANMSDSDKLSFVAIQVRNPDKTDEGNRYVYTNRQNSPYESRPMNFNSLLSEVPWLNDIPNIKSILKYIPLSSKEKINQLYSTEAISVREWAKMPFSDKEQYLVIRKNKKLFSDVSNEEFVRNYLPKYSQLANFIAINSGIVNPIELLKNLDKFNSQDRKSITANLRSKIDLEYLPLDVIPFDVKKLLTILNKWDLKPTDRLYVTKDGSTIVKLNLSNNVSIGLYQAEDDYPNVKLNKRTAKYLLEYPDLDKIPFNILVDLFKDEIVDKNTIDKVLEQAKTDPNSAIVSEEIDGKTVLLDSNSLSAYKIENGTLSKISFDDEDVQSLLTQQTDNDTFQQNVLSYVRSDIDIPRYVEKDSFISIIKSIPLNKRRINWANIPSIVLATKDEEAPLVVFREEQATPFNAILGQYYYTSGWDYNKRSYSENPEVYKSYFAYLRTKGVTYTDDELLAGLGQAGRISNGSVIKAIIEAGIPMAEGSIYKPLIYNDVPYVVNSRTPRDSYGVSPASSKLVKANIPASLAARMLNTTPAAMQGAGQAVAIPQDRRGRPAGTTNAPAIRPATGGGNINVVGLLTQLGLSTAFERLRTLNRLGARRLDVDNAVNVNPNGDRGAARRNNQLGARGNVIQVLAIGPSKIYIIRLANGQTIASINIQPGNSNYILFPQGGLSSLNSPADLMRDLQRRNLAESHPYIVREYLSNHPEHKNEVKNILKKHLNK